QLREVKNLLLDVGNIVDSYIAQEDWRVKENANATWSFSGLLWHVTGTVMAYYALNLVYPKEIAKAHIEGDFHLHNLSMSLAGYCAGWSLRQLLYEGFNGVPGKVESSPPKHLRSALGQMVNFIGTLQNEWAGAQAFSSFDTYLAPFVNADRLSYAEVKQAIQEFVFGINISSRWGGQTPFSNITLDWVVPEDLKDEHVIIGGKITNDVYGDFQDEMDMINKAFMEVMLEGDAKGRVFTFPIPTYNITKDFDWDSENAELLFEMTAKYGLPYFQNFINSDLNPRDVRAMCCHLQLNLKELRNKTGALFGAGESTGSIGVITINMPRIGYLSKDETEFFERLDRFMYLAKQALEIKRKIVSRNMDAGLLPYTKRYLGTLKNHFSTIGLVGMNEACLNFLGVSIAEKEGKKFALKTLDFMRDKLIEFQEETGHLYNLEATPAEGTAYRLAKIDKKYYPEIITAGNSIPYYTNSTHLPVEYTDDLWFALKHQEDLQVKYTGGTVFHVFLGESPTSEETRVLVKKIAENFKIPYYTITPTFSICPNHGYLNGENSICPVCKAPSEVYSRVVGYLRPVKDWNEGKQEEFKERKEYKIIL
ncbi:MAG: ribonucleoside triphosphate reductase, partial [Candidatus Bathyarchaeia archaeon]